MSKTNTLDEWREIAEAQVYQLELVLKRNLPCDTILRAYLDPLPGRSRDPQNPDQLYNLTFWITSYCAEYHPGADPMVFDDVYRIIAKAHAVEQLCDFTAEYPSPEYVDRTFRRAMHNWAIVRDRIIEHERCAPAQSNAIQPDVVHNAENTSASKAEPIACPTRPVSVAHAAQYWFKCDTRVLNDRIKRGQVRAEQQSPKRLLFDLDEVVRLNPELDADADPALYKPKPANRRKKKPAT